MTPALKDAIVFHSSLNPAIWGDEKMLPEVREDLMKIMDDFREFLGVDNLDIVDITVSGSNAAYTYTPHSDIDLHLVVNVPETQDALYTELFDAKKALYNLTRHIKVRGFDVELYVQNSKLPVESMGIYSVLRDKWISFPRRVKAEINDVSVLARVRIYTRRINEALASDDLELAKRVWRDFRAMRKAGLDKGGEFSPENLAYKILRTREFAAKLYDHILALKDKQLSLEHIEESRVDELFKAPVDMKIVRDASHSFTATTMINGREIQFGASTWLSPGEWKVAFLEKVGSKAVFDMTGSGGEIQVMNFVKQCMAMLIEKHRPESISFDADNKDESRVSLYARMLKRYKPDGYNLVTMPNGGDTEFTLVRANAKVVNELFDAPVQKKVVSDDASEYKVEADIGGRVVTFLAKHLRQVRDGSGWAILFFEQSGRSVNYDMSGNGKEFEVMGFVKTCLTDLIAKHNPQYLVFSSQKTKNDSRAGAYDRIITRYLSSKYDVTKWSDDTETNFTLQRKE